jgi:hypothetical protein
MSQEAALIPRELMNRIATYLSQRPYFEVARLFEEIALQVRLADGSPLIPEKESAEP